MRVKNLRIRNFKSLVDVELSNLPNLVILIGRNSSGKSNVLDALALLLTEPERQLGTLDDYHHLFPNHNTGIIPSPEITCTITLSPNEWVSLIGVNEQAAKGIEDVEILIAKKITINEGVAHWTNFTIHFGKIACVENGEILEPTTVLERFPDDDGIPFSISLDTGTLLSQLEKSLKEGFRVVHTTENSRSWSDGFSERPSIVANEHENALWELSQSPGSRRARWTTLTKRYEEIAPNEQRPVGVASSIRMEEGTLTIPLGMTGEGSQAMLRLMDQLEDESPIIAIEEPETHLHPGLVKQVGNLLKEKANYGNQFFVCTHSPFLIEQSSLDNVYVVKKESSGTAIHSIGDLEGLRDTLLDLGMRPSDILFCNAILLVEGLSDEIFFNGLSNRINSPLVETYVKFIRAGGYPSGRHKIEFWAEVGRDASLPLYLILDKDAQNEVDKAVSKGLIAEEQCLILQKGNLEDHYPWSLLGKATSTLFDITIDDAIPIDTRGQELKKRFC